MLELKNIIMKTTTLLRVTLKESVQNLELISSLCGRLTNTEVSIPQGMHRACDPTSEFSLCQPQLVCFHVCSWFVSKTDTNSMLCVASYPNSQSHIILSKTLRQNLGQVTCVLDYCVCVWHCLRLLSIKNYNSFVSKIIHNH